ncbi:ISAs1 family transposase [Runella slithyformis]|uniref:ISAs1 family transposase n=1 Tax=Runella slithyformis TaxID=106 RepID=UPI00059D7D94|nr:ISAs1 family transposase [Runella slithyformis]
MARATPLTPLTINAIHLAKGVYVVGLKSNQKHLYRYCLCKSLVKKPLYERTDAIQRGHGRLEERTYSCFSINPLALDLRWKDSGMATFICVKRIRQNLDGTQLTEEVSYFISNFDALRQHWRIEVMQYQRDVILSEDALRTGNASVSRLMSSLRTLTINLLKRTKSGNMAAQIDNFADKFQTLIQFMTQQLVL